MTARWNYLWALFLFLHLHAVVASPLQVLRREDATAAVTMAPTATATGNERKEDTVSSVATEGPNTTHKPTPTMTTTFATTSTTSFPSAINGNTPNNTSSMASPDSIPEGELPLKPRLTPGWGFAGALFLITGGTFTLIGIKKAWLHTFFSAAFLSGLSVTVLIVYVMTPPIPAAIEGAYVVAAVVAGLILGGAATVFREITEGLGCLLGGFCVSMWLLTLKPGGLLPATAPKIIFIAAFSVGSYGFYFSHYTRPYALMGLMSFAGATITVLGIDCFSRAGLKEFWAYIWDLNGSLFPDVANTYPLTKGIRVEIALTVVFTIIGIISQLKLWKIVQERRAKRTEEQTKEQLKRDEEEASLGLQIEAQNAKERRQWETVYGDQPPQSSAGSGNSGTDDLDEEKKDHTSQTVVEKSSLNDDHVKTGEASTSSFRSSSSPPEKPADELMMMNDNRKITGAVTDFQRQDLASPPNSNQKVPAHNRDSGVRPSSPTSSQITQIPSKSPEPQITPLPFKIPNEFNGDDSRSSIATYADEDDGDYILSEKRSELALTKRLSASSGKLLRSLSQRSIRSQTSKQKTGEFGAQNFPRWLGSTEGLIENSKRHSDAISVAATVDGLSDDGNDDSRNETQPTSASAAVVGTKDDIIATDSRVDDTADSKTKLEPPNFRSPSSTRPTSSVEIVGAEIPNAPAADSFPGDPSEPDNLYQAAGTTGNTNKSSESSDMNIAEVTSENPPPPKSMVPSIASTNMSLTKDRLPSALPRVALSYRTNEWAKHLSAAEAPPLEQLQLDEYADCHKDEVPENEAVAPIHLEELRQMSSSTTSPTANIRPHSSASNPPQTPSPVYQSMPGVASYSPPPQGHIPATLAILTSASSEVGGQESSVTLMPPNSSQAVHSFRNKGQRKLSEVYNQPIEEEIGDAHLAVEQSTLSDGDGRSTPISIPPSPSPIGSAPISGVVPYSNPQTLLSKREMFLRNGSRAHLFSTPPIQESPEYRTGSTSQLSLHNHAATPPPPLMVQDADDMPLSQRKQIIRQSSMLSAFSGNLSGSRPQQGGVLNASLSPMSSPTTRIHTITAESSNFDSHQPQRRSSRVSQAERDAKLSLFRQSVAADLRAASPTVQKPAREAPVRHSTSSTSLLGLSSKNAEIGRAIDQQRNVLMSQREQEARKREMEFWEKERHDRVFEEMMRSGDLMDAHREALRRMQGGVKQE